MPLLLALSLLGCSDKPAYVSQEAYIQRHAELLCFYDQECNDADAAQYPSYGECLASFVSAITPNDMPCYSGTHAAEALEVMEGWSCEEGLIWPEVTDWVYQASSANTACGLGGT